MGFQDIKWCFENTIKQSILVSDASFSFIFIHYSHCDIYKHWLSISLMHIQTEQRERRHIFSSSAHFWHMARIVVDSILSSTFQLDPAISVDLPLPSSQWWTLRPPLSRSSSLMGRRRLQGSRTRRCPMQPSSPSTRKTTPWATWSGTSFSRIQMWSFRGTKTPAPLKIRYGWTLLISC